MISWEVFPEKPLVSFGYERKHGCCVCSVSPLQLRESLEFLCTQDIAMRRSLAFAFFRVFSRYFRSTKGHAKVSQILRDLELKASDISVFCSLFLG